MTSLPYVDPDPLMIDHLRLVTSREHRRRYTRAWQRMTRQGGVHIPHVLHEHDDRCCELEPWPVSLRRLCRDAGVRALVVWLR